MLKYEGPMCAIAWLIGAQGAVGKQNEFYLNMNNCVLKKRKKT